MTDRVEFDQSGFVSAGYYLCKRAQRADITPNVVIPDLVLSASSCLCEFFPNSWAIAWSSVSEHERSQRAAAMGLREELLPEATSWATEAFSQSFGWPNAFYTLEAAQQARTLFLADDPGVTTFGLGLDASNAKRLLRAAEPEPTKPGCATQGETGIYQCVRRRVPLAPKGNAAGFELLAALFGTVTCSWLCNGLDKECAQKLGINTNSRGLVSSLDDALRCAELISRPQTAAEPGLWLPWLLTIYPVLD